MRGDTGYFSVRMSSQVWYRTNADYERTWKRLAENPMIASVDRTEKGLLQFRFKRTSTVFMLSPRGILWTRWNSEGEKAALFNYVSFLLVPREGSKLEITPLKQQIKIDYPSPGNIKLYWCSEGDVYRKDYVWMFFNKLFNFMLMLPAYLMLGLVLGLLRKTGRF